MSTPNAQRLRLCENQRRSRQRKKEYLSSLECRLQNCKRSGVSASVELQTAARHVVDENNRLRALLRTKGVSDGEIDDFLSSRAGECGERESCSRPVAECVDRLQARECTGEEDDIDGEIHNRLPVEIVPHSEVEIEASAMALPIPAPLSSIPILPLQPQSHSTAHTPPHISPPDQRPDQQPNQQPALSLRSLPMPNSQVTPSQYHQQSFVDLSPGAGVYSSCNDECYPFPLPPQPMPAVAPQLPFPQHQQLLQPNTTSCGVAIKMTEECIEPVICPAGDLYQGCSVENNVLFSVLDRATG